MWDGQHTLTRAPSKFRCPMRKGRRQLEETHFRAPFASSLNFTRARIYFIHSTNFHRQDQRLFTVFNLTSIIYFHGSRTLSQKSPKSKTAVEVSGVSERELKIDIMYPLSNHNNFGRVVRSSWILTVGLRPSYKNIALFVFWSHFFDSWIRKEIDIFESRKNTTVRAIWETANYDFICFANKGVSHRNRK